MITKRLALAFALIPGIAQADPLDTRTVRVTPTITASSAYTSGNEVGGQMTFTGICNKRTNRGEVIGAQLLDKAVQGIDTDLVLFRAAPSGGTLTDKSAFTPADASLASVTAVIPLTTHKAFADNGVSQGANIVYPVQCDAAGNLYGFLVTRGTPTYASTTDLTLQLEVLAD